MEKAKIRMALVAVIYILLFELLARPSVHWRERTEELCSLALLIALLAGLVWAVLPAFAHMRTPIARILSRALLVLLLFVGLYAVGYFYFCHIRPNLGWYREPDWVAQHPQFQRQLRARIEANMWKSPKKPDTPDSQ